MQKLGFLFSVCMISALLLSCTPQSVATQEIIPSPTTSPLVDSGIVLLRGNPQRTGVFDAPAIREQPEVKWKTKISSTWLMPPLYADGMLYTGSGDGVLYAVNAETGEQVWSADGFGQLETTGAISGNIIVSGGYSKQVKALDRLTGAELWLFASDFVVQGEPLIVGNGVYIATDHTVYALDLKSGKLDWATKSGMQDAYMAGPAYDNVVIYTTAGKLLLALNAETGVEVWRVEKPEIFVGFAVANHMIYVGNWDLNLYAFDQSTGEEKWKFPAQTGGVFWSSPAVDENTVYAGNIDKYVYALNAQTGELRWSFKTGGAAVSEPSIVGGIVYVSDSSHEFPRGARHLYALDATTGEQLWVFETVSTFLPAPALGEDTIYITASGDVFALH
jgi:eukaryotic-like serine/threonine-protein kinase